MPAFWRGVRAAMRLGDGAPLRGTLGFGWLARGAQLDLRLLVKAKRGNRAAVEAHQPGWHADGGVGCLQAKGACA